MIGKTNRRRIGEGGGTQTSDKWQEKERKREKMNLSYWN